MTRIFLILLLNLSATLYAQLDAFMGRPAILQGGAGTAGPSNADTVGLNPAHVGAADRSEVNLRSGFSKYEYIQRYPGFEAHTSGKSGLSPALPIPGLLYKFSRRIGVAGIVIPFSVKQDIKVKRLPIVILGQQNYVDIIGSGQLAGAADITLGYYFNPTVSAGMNFSYTGIKASAALYPSGGDGVPLATFVLNSTTVSVGFGIKFNFHQFSIGLATKIFEQVSSNTKFESPLAKAQATGAETPGGNSGGSSSAQVFSPLRLGVEAKLGRGLTVMADLEYSRADKRTKRFSVVDFSEKDVDAYDTLSFYSAGRYQQNSKIAYLLGYLYEPGSIGPGTPGKNGKAGFGFLDLALNRGEPPSTPVWAAGAGGRFEFDRIVLKRKQDSIPQYRMAVESGFVYSETSIGVDESGEQPGAYLVTRYTIPVNFTYRF